MKHFCRLTLLALLYLSAASSLAGGIFIWPEISFRGGPPGETAVFALRVYNQTGGGTSVLFVVDNICPGYSAVVDPAVVWIGASESTNITLSITPPAGGSDACTIDVEAWSDISLMDVAHVSLASLAAATGSVLRSYREGRADWQALETNRFARLEWAADLRQPWRASWQGLDLVDAPTAGVISVERPRFYRLARDPRPAGMEWIDDGAFVMGDGWAEGFPDEWPAHEVRTGPFYMDRYEVSLARWRDVWQQGGFIGYVDIPAGSSFGSGFNWPVTDITWYDAVKWCNARSEVEGLKPCYYTSRSMTPSTVYRTGQVDVVEWTINWLANGYRLPTEAEWEKAARGGLKGHHYPWRSFGGAWSNHILGAWANFDTSLDPYDQAATPVGFFNGSQQGGGAAGFELPQLTDMSNPFGLYDMAGNVREWCGDWYAADYYASLIRDEPRGPAAGLERTARGGSWKDKPYNLRCAQRFAVTADTHNDFTGLRCVRHP
mgnify:CR=1 FL=1